MANWASTAYAIEGPKDILKKIEKAILNQLEAGESKGWEGSVLKALGISWEPRTIVSEETQGDLTIVKTSGYYMRGFIQDEPWFDGDTLHFYAEEAWGATDFNEVLENRFPEIKVYYSVEEWGEEVYATNDKEGKYFPDRFYVDICIDGQDDSDYFVTEDSVYAWLMDKTNGRVGKAEDVEAFNSDYEDSGADDENYIYIHEFSIVD